jgi:ABC-type uncharacterized transport system substrate-binding protein
MSKWRIGGIVLCLGLVGGVVALKEICGGTAPGGAQAGEEAPVVSRPAIRPRVLLVHSYHAGYPWVDAITRGVRMALPASDVDLQVIYMDTKRNTDEAFKQQAGEEARRIVAEWQPRVVITADDNAQEYFAAQHASEGATQFVFCGVNANPEKYGYPAANVTGVLERPHYRDSIALLRQLMPDVTRIALLSDDSPTSAGALQFMSDEETETEIVSKEMATTFEQWKAAVRRLQSSADAIAIYMYHTVKESGNPVSLDPKIVMDWTVAESSVPIIGFFIFAVDDGALCGFLESGVEHGFRAGQMAAEILRGKSAGAIPIVTALEGQSMLNLKTAQKLNLTVPDSITGGIDVLVED